MNCDPDQDFNEIPVPQGLEDEKEPPLLSTSMMELQEELAPIKKNSYKTIEKVELIMNSTKLPVFDEFKTSENQAETIASKFKMLKDRPIKLKRSAIIKLTAKTYQLWREQKDGKKADKHKNSAEKSKSQNLEKSTLE